MCIRDRGVSLAVEATRQPTTDSLRRAGAVTGWPPGGRAARRPGGWVPPPAPSGPPRRRSRIGTARRRGPRWPRPRPGPAQGRRCSTRRALAWSPVPCRASRPRSWPGTRTEPRSALPVAAYVRRSRRWRRPTAGRTTCAAVGRRRRAAAARPWPAAGTASCTPSAAAGPDRSARRRRRRTDVGPKPSSATASASGGARPAARRPRRPSRAPPRPLCRHRALRHPTAGRRRDRGGGRPRCRHSGRGGARLGRRGRLAAGRAPPGADAVADDGFGPASVRLRRRLADRSGPAAALGVHDAVPAAGQGRAAAARRRLRRTYAATGSADRGSVLVPGHERGRLARHGTGDHANALRVEHRRPCAGPGRGRGHRGPRRRAVPIRDLRRGGPLGAGGGTQPPGRRAARPPGGHPVTAPARRNESVVGCRVASTASDTPRSDRSTGESDMAPELQTADDLRGQPLPVRARPTAPGAGTARPVRRGPPAVPLWQGLLRQARPKQWAKNVLVVAAPGAAGVLTHRNELGLTALAFVAFCLTASGVYYLNDARDIESDRLHPKKRHRPMAAGVVPLRLGIAVGLGPVSYTHLTLPT